MPVKKTAKTKKQSNSTDKKKKVSKSTTKKTAVKKTNKTSTKKTNKKSNVKSKNPKTFANVDEKELKKVKKIRKATSKKSSLKKPKAKKSTKKAAQSTKTKKQSVKLTKAVSGNTKKSKDKTKQSKNTTKKVTSAIKAINNDSSNNSIATAFVVDTNVETKLNTTESLEPSTMSEDTLDQNANVTSFTLADVVKDEGTDNVLNLDALNSVSDDELNSEEISNSTVSNKSSPEISGLNSLSDLQHIKVIETSDTQNDEAKKGVILDQSESTTPTTSQGENSQKENNPVVDDLVNSFEIISTNGNKVDIKHDLVDADSVNKTTDSFDLLDNLKGFDPIEVTTSLGNNYIETKNGEGDIEDLDPDIKKHLVIPKFKKQSAIVNAALALFFVFSLSLVESGLDLVNRGINMQNNVNSPKVAGLQTTALANTSLEKTLIDNDPILLLQAIARHIVLPSNELPSISTIKDPIPLIAQDKFFIGSNIGDKVLVYRDSGKMIIYSIDKDKIVNFASTSSSVNSDLSVSLEPQNDSNNVLGLQNSSEENENLPTNNTQVSNNDKNIESTVVNAEPSVISSEVKVITVEVRNASQKAGLAGAYASKIKQYDNYDVIKVGNSIDDYTTSTIINLNNIDNAYISDLATELGEDTVITLNISQSEASSEADLLVIVYEE